MGPIIPNRFFEWLMTLALIGIVALIGIGGFGLYWLITHVTIGWN